VPRPSAMRRACAAVAALTVAVSGLVGLGLPAFADHGPPTATDVARARAAAQAKAREVGRVKARLALADAQLRSLQAKTRAAIAAYQAAQQQLAEAQHVAALATLAVQRAQGQVDTAHHDVDVVAVEAYRSGGDLAFWAALTSAQGPQAFIDQASQLQTISIRRQDALGRFRAAEVVRTLSEQKAQAALGKVRTAAAAAAVARNNAQHAVTDQRRSVVALAGQKVSLEAQLSTAQHHAADVAHAHAVAVERARAAAARRAAAAQAAIDSASQGVDQENPVAPSGGQPSQGSASQGREALDFARKQLGKPYSWGASGPDSYDCSGLTMASWGSVGVYLDHYSVAQYGEGEHVSRDNLRPGDLVFFATDTSDPSTIHHVGIYAGGGQMIDAPYTGVDVRYDYAFRSDYIGATRP
jgi:cell wall-associated NlpC family hydrolase